MSYNNNFYNNFPGNNFTFHDYAQPNYVLPPPPLPPPFFMQPTHNAAMNDEEIIKSIEKRIKNDKEKVTSPASISEVKERLRTMISNLNMLKEKQILLSKNIENLSEEEWSHTREEVEKIKSSIDLCLSEINDTYLNVLGKLLAKRSAKRMRQKRQRVERKRDKTERLKQMKENSRKIDEHLQKIKDEIDRAKQEEEDKLQADAVLREVLRKKQDARKCVVKLDALVRLRAARSNTARGRGEAPSEVHAELFNSNVEKLKALWVQKLSVYDKEEAELRATLKHQETRQSSGEAPGVNLDEWRRLLFGGSELPQVVFEDVASFVAVRSQWDRYISPEGTSLPVGWVVPKL